YGLAVETQTHLGNRWSCLYYGDVIDALLSMSTATYCYHTHCQCIDGKTRRYAVAHRHYLVITYCHYIFLKKSPDLAYIGDQRLGFFNKPSAAVWHNFNQVNLGRRDFNNTAVI